MSEVTAEHFDVLVVGAGVSGIGAAVHLQQKCPGYLIRALDLLPKQGDRDPWRFENDYYVERHILPSIDLDEPELVDT